MKYAIALLAATLSTAWGQTITLPQSLDKLAAKAKEHVEVTLDSSLLQMAGNFLSAKDADQAKAKQLISGIKGIVVRSFEFAKADEYTDADLDGVRQQLRSPGWNKIVNVKEGRETTEVYLRTGNNQITGITVLAAEARELTVVMIDGSIKPEDLAGLQGNFGIPKLGLDNMVPGAKKAPAAKKSTGNKDEEE